MKSAAAISALVRPSATSARTSASRAVKPTGWAFVAGRGPRDIWRNPSSRHRRVTRAAAGRAPRASKIQRCLVCPVSILDDEDGRARSRAQLRQDSGEHPVAPGIHTEKLLSLSAKRRCGVQERAKRTRGRERVANADERSCGAPNRLHELLNERRLADTLLSAQEDKAAAPLAGPAKQRSEYVGIRFTFQEFHRRAFSADRGTGRIGRLREQVSDSN
jgi:hypothetical protein